MTSSFHLWGGTEKNLKIKIYPTCFEKVFFRKNSLRGLQWYIFPLDILYGIGEKRSANLPDGETPLISAYAYSGKRNDSMRLIKDTRLYGT